MSGEDWPAYWCWQVAHGRVDEVESGWCPVCEGETATARMRGHEGYRPFCASCGEWRSGHLRLVRTSAWP